MGCITAMIDEAQVSVTHNGDGVVIEAGGSLTFMNCEEFAEKLLSSAASADHLTVDLTPAEFIDTQIVQDLGRAAVAMIKRGRRLNVVALAGSYPMRVVDISGYQQIMDVETRVGPE